MNLVDSAGKTPRRELSTKIQARSTTVFFFAFFDKNRNLAKNPQKGFTDIEFDRLGWLVLENRLVFRSTIAQQNMQHNGFAIFGAGKQAETGWFGAGKQVIRLEQKQRIEGKKH